MEFSAVTTILLTQCSLASFIPSTPLQRVKVYRLNDDGKWDDKGTGRVSVEYLEVLRIH